MQPILKITFTIPVFQYENQESGDIGGKDVLWKIEANSLINAHAQLSRMTNAYT